MNELPIIQKTYDFIQWYIPVITRLPRSHRFTLGDRIASGLYDLLDGLITAKYASQKMNQLYQLNTHLEVLRYQTRLLYDFELLNIKRYEYASLQLRSIGIELGGWLRQQQQKT